MDPIKLNEKTHDDACEDLELRDFDVEGTPQMKVKVDPIDLLQKMSQVCIDSTVIESLKRFCDQKNTKLVLGLAGGAAKGMVGNCVLIYLLDKLNLLSKFEEIWGTSAGAIVGAGVSLGIPISDIITTICNARNRDLLEFSITGTIKNQGMFKTQKTHDFLNQSYKNRTYNDCRIPFYALAVEFDGKSEKIKVFNEGNIIDSVLASMCLPEIFEPMNIHGKTYVDGGLIENIPSVSILRHHYETKDSRKLVILSVGFGEEHYDPKLNLSRKLVNLFDMTLHQLQLVQLSRVRESSNTEITYISIDVPITRFDFNKMGTAILPCYLHLLQKLGNFAIATKFNQNF